MNKPAWLFQKAVPWWVGVGIVAFVIFIVFPRDTRLTKRQQASCQSHERQTAMSLIAYAQDNDDMVPPAEKWMDLTQSYLPSSKENRIYHCPSVTENETDPSYAFDDEVSTKDRQKVTNAAQVRMVYESIKNVRNAHDAGTSLPVPGRHASGNNIGYVDGHVKWIKDATVP